MKRLTREDIAERMKALEECFGDRSAVADRYGVSYQTVGVWVKRARQYRIAVRSGRRRPAPPEKPASWEEYIAGGRSDDGMRQRLISDCLPRLDRLAMKVARRTGAEHGDLISAGALGLIDAAKRFEPGKGCAFWTFASPRCYGAMRDWMRSLDEVPRLTRQRINRRETAEATLAQELGRRPTDEEVFEALNWTQKEIADCAEPRRLEGDAHVNAEGREAGDFRDFLTAFCEKPESRVEFETLFRKATERLPMMACCVLYLRVINGSTQKAIGEAFGISESRISQIMRDSRAEVERSLVHLQD